MTDLDERGMAEVWNFQKHSNFEHWSICDDFLNIVEFYNEKSNFCSNFAENK